MRALPDVPGFDSTIDYITAIDAAEPISAAGLAELHTRIADKMTVIRGLQSFDTHSAELLMRGTLTNPALLVMMGRTAEPIHRTAD